MDYTNNYHLPQWVKSDRIMMDDFNQMNRNIESALNTSIQTANSAKSTANAAKSAASAAQSAANAAQSTANQALAALPYAVGSYTGTGQSMTFKTGFRPRFLIVDSHFEGSRSSGSDNYCCATAGTQFPTVITFNSDGFTLSRKDDNTYPNLIQMNRIYTYIAFK